MATILRSPIGSGFWLEPRAAASYLRARAAGMPAGLTSAGRDWDQQMRLYNGWVAQREGFNFALHPSKSLHCLGRAVDLAGDIDNPATARGWMRKHGRAYGWTPVTNEPWHFEYNAANDKHQEDDMPLNDADKNWIRGAIRDALDAALKTVPRESTAVDHTDLSLRIIKAAGSSHDDAVRFEDTASYAQAIAFGVEALLKRSGAATDGPVNLTPADLEAIARAINDDAARRLAE